MIGQTISHYKILEKLGEGGMGAVYKAQDLKLDRLVALKFLPPEFTRDPDAKQRFIHEAKSASSLDHPNICNVHEVDETSDGQLFIAMAMYDGTSLSKKIEKGPLKIEETLDIASQVAEGLQAAHEKGITHRDIKTSNVIITEKGRAVIMDFGLARTSGATKLTKSGSTVGTVPYMSPEQARGEKVDHQTDIWSLGVVMYEMVTGRLPFRSEYNEAVVYSIQNENPPPITSLRSDLPMELERIVNKAMQKKASERYQHIDEILVDLRGIKKQLGTQEFLKTSLAEVPDLKKPPWFLRSILGAGIMAALIASYFIFSQKAESGERIPVAVVDFVNETNEEELNGLSGMLITSLEQSRRLSVLTRSRMLDILKLMGKEDISRIDENLGREICRRANVNALAVASIRKLGRKYIIDLKIIDPTKNEYLVTAKEEVEEKEIISSMIDRLSEKTRIGLKEKSTEIQAANQKIAQVTTANLEAYQHYFQGEDFINKLKWSEAEEELKKAIALDSTFAVAYYRLAYALYWNSKPEALNTIHKALQYLAQAPEKEQSMIRALSAQIEGNADASIAQYREIVQRYPEEKEALFQIADQSFHDSEIEEAVKYLRKVLEVDPTFARAWEHMVWAFQWSGQYEEMLKNAIEYVAKAPGEEAFRLLADAYGLRGNFDEALKVHERYLQLFPQSPWPRAGIAAIFLFKDKVKEAETEYEKLLQVPGTTSHKRVGYTGLSICRAYQGKYREAIRMLDRTDQDNTGSSQTGLNLESCAAKAFWLATTWRDRHSVTRAVEKAIQTKGEKDFAYNFFLFNSYVQIGEYEKASALERTHLLNVFPFLNFITTAYGHRGRGQYAKALKDFQMYLEQERFVIASKLFFGYDIAECYFRVGENDKALQTVLEFQSIRSQMPNEPDLIFSGLFFRATYYPRCFYLLGKIHENNGETKLAAESYQKFLGLWKDADPDLPELIDGKARLRKLKRRELH